MLLRVPSDFVPPPKHLRDNKSRGATTLFS
jgi:hypothetical protein